MIISLIVATDRKRGIGVEGRLPWRLSADLKRFRKLTMGHHLIVGRKTFDSIGKPLPGRTMIIVTRDRDYQAAGCLIAHSLDEAISHARESGEDEVFIGGGGEIYAQALRFADRLYLTLVDAEVTADTFFPKFDAREWVEQSTVDHQADEKNQYSFTFKSLVRSAQYRER